VNAFLQELFRVSLYKRTQGRITRQVTLAALAAGIALGFWQLAQHMIQWWEWNRIFSLSITTALTLVGWWMAYRLVNLPRFADFLIAVEAEMNKVSWPTPSELFRASLVVLVTIGALAFVLATFDVFWQWIFTDVLRVI